MTDKKKRRKKLGDLLQNKEENHATTFSSNPKKDRLSLVGRNAQTVTALHPTGEIRLNDRLYDAVAHQGSFIEPFATVRITGWVDFRLTVERID